MPGVPRSRGCRNCKRRKVKCSESWPTCRQCIQMGVKCPGPTSLVKFIYDGSHSSAKDDTESDFVVMEPSVSRVEDLDKSLSLQKMSYPNVNDGAAQYGLLRAALCRRNPTTLADRIGLRLVTSMERGPEGITNMYLSYLPELPQRLASSNCLRHSVDLFCAAWTDFRRRRPRGEVMGMPQYGKLLRSLRQALSGDQANTVETLAAITLLERTSRLFDWDRNADIHLKGVLQTFVKRGPPDVTDSLSVAVTNEIHALLLDNRPMGEENDFTRISPWKEAFDQCAENQSRVMDISPFIRSDIMIIYGFFKQLSQLSIDFRKISANPHTEEMISLRSVVSKQLQEMKISSRQIAIVSWEKGIEEGAIKETVDNNSITGSKIHFKSVRLFGLYQRMLLCQLIALRMLYEISVISGSPDDAIFNEYREVGIEAQKMIPYLRSLESIVAIDLLDPIYLSYEAANDREREYILFSIEQINQHIDQLPKDRRELNHLVIESGKLIAGLETLAIAEDGGLALDTTNCAGP